jgi:hypothetical protein
MRPGSAQPIDPSDHWPSSQATIWSASALEPVRRAASARSAGNTRCTASGRSDGAIDAGAASAQLEASSAVTSIGVVFIGAMVVRFE